MLAALILHQMSMTPIFIVQLVKSDLHLELIIGLT
jgi:hypothetical protein